MMVAGTWRGQPLAALVLIVAAWIAVRAVMWNSGLSEPPAPAERPRPVATIASTTTSTDATPRRIAPASLAPALPHPARLLPARASGGADMHAGFAAPAAGAVSHVFPTAQTDPPLSSALAPALDPAEPEPSVPPPAEPPPIRHERRWSADGWLMLRGGGDGSLAAGGGAPATYGASQAGAVLRYRLAPASRHRPAAYLRATAALNGSDEREAALGLSARPIAALPLVAGVEVRAAHRSGGLRLRPAVLLVSELPVLALPAALQAEAYVQAGYVGGRFATAFADGQVRLDRAVGRRGRTTLALGAAAWGGAQKGVARLDLGPTARIAVPLGQDAAARIAVDWRLRVAGDAAPSSGPALTLSAGF